MVEAVDPRLSDFWMLHHGIPVDLAGQQRLQTWK
jgi:hypothetical protein